MQPFAAVAVLASLAMLPSPAVGPGPEIGKPAPAFTLVDAKGKQHSLSDYKGKLVVIEFMNITCPNSRANYEAGVMQNLQKKYEAKDVVWLSMIITQRQQSEFGEDVITRERADSMAHAVTDEFKATPTATLIDEDGKVGTAYGAQTSVHMFVVNKDGKLAYNGALDDQAGEGGVNYVATALDELMAGKSVTTTMTMPYGCHPVGDFSSEQHASSGQ